jgi:hypothetical protein
LQGIAFLVSAGFRVLLKEHQARSSETPPLNTSQASSNHVNTMAQHAESAAFLQPSTGLSVGSSQKIYQNTNTTAKKPRMRRLRRRRIQGGKDSRNGPVLEANGRLLDAGELISIT